MNQEVKLNKSFFTALIILLIILVILALWVGLKASQSTRDSSNYSAVYLTTGEIYFGKLHHFPKFYLSNAWLLQRTTPTEDNLGINIIPFRSAFWGPIDKIYLNSNQVVFTTKLRDDSQVKDLITGALTANNQPSGEVEPLTITP